MTTSENGINVDDRRVHGDPNGIGGVFTDMEAESKRETSSFSRIKNKVLFLIDQPENPGYREIQ